MKYSTFGRTGWQVSEIGFDAWQLGGDWGRVDENSSIDTLHYAFGKGLKGRCLGIVGPGDPLVGRHDPGSSAAIERAAGVVTFR